MTSSRSRMPKVEISMATHNNMPLREAIESGKTIPGVTLTTNKTLRTT
jgi:hypothetical protein